MQKIELYMDYLKKYNLVDLNTVVPNSDEIQIHCPYRYELHKNADKNKSASFNLIKGLWICYGCDKRGSIVHIINKFDNKNLSSLKEIEPVVDDDTSLIDRILNIIEIINHDTPTIVNELIEEVLDTLDYNHDYLKSRNKSESTYRHFQVGYDMPTDSIALPIYNLSGNNIMGIQCRNLNTLPKYNFILKCDKSKTFFGTQHIDDWAFPIIVEGAFSVLNFFENGYRNVIATLGSPSDTQIDHINKLSVMPTLIFDNDLAGNRMVKKFIKQCTLPCRIPSTDYGEVDELSNYDIRQILDNRRFV